MTKEEKDKLIALSDLNREDNIKYISSEAQGIAITLDSDRYAPTFCKLERAYICGRRKSEEQIAVLEKRCANYEMTISKMEKGTCDICKETEKDKKIEELEAQIEKMKCCGNCQTVRDAEGNCYLKKDGKCKNLSEWEIKEK